MSQTAEAAQRLPFAGLFDQMFAPLSGRQSMLGRAQPMGQ